MTILWSFWCNSQKHLWTLFKMNKFI